LADLSAIQKDDADVDSNAGPVANMLSKLDDKVDDDADKPLFGRANHSRQQSNQDSNAAAAAGVDTMEAAFTKFQDNVKKEVNEDNQEYA
jgi:hypothetical protein